MSLSLLLWKADLTSRQENLKSWLSSSLGPVGSYSPGFHLGLLLTTNSVRHLYEKEKYQQAREFIRRAVMLLSSDNTLMLASARMLEGLIDLDTNNVPPALDLFISALDVREKLLDAEDPFVASSLNAISLAYTELGDYEKAIEAGQRAIDIRLRTDRDRIGNSYSNMASTLLRMGKSDEAEEMLKRCPSLKEFTDETFLMTGNPRFSGYITLQSCLFCFLLSRFVHNGVC